jgi:hypothetical protein
MNMFYGTLACNGYEYVGIGVWNWNEYRDYKLTTVKLRGLSEHPLEKLFSGRQATFFETDALLKLQTVTLSLHFPYSRTPRYA